MVQAEELSTETWSFTEFVLYQSLRFSHLTPLAEFLTGRHSEPHWSFPWSRSQIVNVVVVDIGPGNGEPSNETSDAAFKRFRHVRTVGDLRQELDIPVDIVARLFLVEDMVAPVVDLLGSAFKCQPDFFWNHMLYEGLLWQKGVAEAGNKGGGRGSPMIHNTVLPSARRRSYFSLPLRRYSENSEQCVRSQKKRTLFRSHSEEESVLEERVTGSIFKASNGGQAGILLFDSSSRGVFPGDKYSMFESPPQYDPKRISTPVIPLGTSMRDIFLRGLRSTWSGVDSGDTETAILRPLLRIIRHEWAKIIESASYHIAYSSAKVEFYEHYELKAIRTRQGILEENLGMLQECMALIRQGGTRKPDQEHKTGQNNTLGEEFKDDFEYLISRTKECIEQNARNTNFINALTAIQDARNGLELTEQAIKESKRSVELSQKGIKQAENIQALTSLATFYIPLSFVCSFFGMNVSQLTGQSPTSLWVVFVVAIPLTLVSLFTVYHWEQALRIWRYCLRFAKSSSRKVSSFTTRGVSQQARDEEQNRVSGDTTRSSS